MTLAYRNCRIPALLLLGCAFFLLNGCAARTPSVRPSLAAKDLLAPSEERHQLEKLPVADLLQGGSYALSQGNTTLAQTHFVLALEKDPESIAARLGLAQVALANGERRNARSMVEEVLEKEPDNAGALLLHGRMLRAAGELEAAVADFSSALQSLPKDPVLLSELAATYDLIPTRLSESEALYRQVVALLPGDAAARNNLGFNCLLQGRAAEASAILTSALAIAPKNQRIVNNLAAAYLLAGEEEKALQLFRKSVGLAEAYNNLGYLYMTQKRWDQADAAYARALELNPRYYVRADANRQLLKSLRGHDAAPALPAKR